MQFSLVLPCYNPPLDWHKNVVHSVKSISERTQSSIELVIVNDGASSGVNPDFFEYITANLSNTKIIHHPENKGKGNALRTGVSSASEEIIVFTDIDFPYREDSFIALFEELKKGSDVVLGHRGASYYKNTPLSRKIISKSLRFFLKTFLRIPTDDSQCGIKGFNSKGKAVFLSTTIDRFLFDLEFIKLAARKKLDIKTVNVELKPGVVFSKVNLSILAKEGINFLKILFR
ncbi:MAG: glycosyltransferase family 2 protein [Bacteroidota bacterium]